MHPYKTRTFRRIVCDICGAPVSLVQHTQRHFGLLIPTHTGKIKASTKAKSTSNSWQVICSKDLHHQCGYEMNYFKKEKLGTECFNWSNPVRRIDAIQLLSEGKKK